VGIAGVHVGTAAPGCPPGAARLYPARLKYCTARSCFSAASRDANVPRFFRFPVFASFLREYKRYPPDCNLRIMNKRCRRAAQWLAQKKRHPGAKTS
jgi:hypothetical protein